MACWLWKVPWVGADARKGWAPCVSRQISGVPACHDKAIRRTCLPVKPWQITFVSLVMLRFFTVESYAVDEVAYGRAPAGPDRGYLASQ